MITMIVAHDKNLCIGGNNKLLWHIPEDFKHFKSYTLNKQIVMGRKTLESIGKPLPNRINNILTKNKNKFSFVEMDNLVFYENFNDLVNMYKDSTDELVICGGAEIYKMFLPYANKLVISYVYGDYIGDKYFPEYRKDFELESQIHKEKFEIQYYKRKGLL